MEISRWGFEKITRISDRYRHLREFLADVLEGERSLIANDTAIVDNVTTFETANDIERLETMPFPSRKRSPDRADAILQALSPFFEAGFVLREMKQPGGASVEILESMFLFGRVFSPPMGEAPQVEMPLPKMEPGVVYRGRVLAVLRAFRLEALKSLHDATAFAFQPKPGIVILLICNRPHPWQVDAIEKAYRAVTLLFEKGARP